MSELKRVVITGMGIVSPIGNNQTEITTKEKSIEKAKLNV